MKQALSTYAPHDGIRLFLNQISIDLGPFKIKNPNSDEEKTSGGSKNPSGCACRLLPRRLQFPDSTNALKLYQQIDFSPIRKIESIGEHKDGSLIFDGKEILMGILEAFMGDWYSQSISYAEEWQKHSLEALIGENISSLTGSCK